MAGKYFINVFAPIFQYPWCLNSVLITLVAGIRKRPLTRRVQPQMWFIYAPLQILSVTACSLKSCKFYKVRHSGTFAKINSFTQSPTNRASLHICVFSLQFLLYFYIWVMHSTSWAIRNNFWAKCFLSCITKAVKLHQCTFKIRWSSTV